MCGIAGVLYADRHRPVESAALQAMGDAIAHRGPDAEGYFSQPGLGLVHRRLSIIDVAGGDQPLSNEDGSIQVVFNGEIYNYAALRDELVSKGHVFRTQSDTEVLVHLYEELGERLVERLRGMFAFALWDTTRQELLLARDRLGLKPLYVYRDAEKLLFGSELKAILAHNDVDRQLDPAALEDYLCYGVVPGQRTILRRASKLSPATTCMVRSTDFAGRARTYWRYQPQVDTSRSVAEWTEAIQDKLAETVAAHRIADVPVGAFLSGGVDSSVMVALLAEQQSSPLATFAVGFQEEAFSELPYAREVAQQFGCEHHEELVTPQAVSSLDRLVQFYDEPFADISAIPTMHLAQVARQHVKVAISGDGGDEAFGGYARYSHDLQEARLRRALPGWFRRGVLGPVGRLWPKADWLPRALRAKTRLTNLSLSPARAYANTISRCRLPTRRQLLSPDLLGQLSGYSCERSVLDAFAAAPTGDALAGMIAADVSMLLPDDFLTKVDRASMSCGLEVRPPLVDHELLELTAQIPSELKVRDGETKWIFKKAYAGQLPANVTQRAKQGFDIPIDTWLRGPLVEMFHDVVLSPGSGAGEFLSTPTIDRIWRAHQSGRGRHGNVLWSLLVFAQWADRYLDSRPPTRGTLTKSRNISAR